MINDKLFHQYHYIFYSFNNRTCAHKQIIIKIIIIAAFLLFFSVTLIKTNLFLLTGT